MEQISLLSFPSTMESAVLIVSFKNKTKQNPDGQRVQNAPFCVSCSEISHTICKRNITNPISLVFLHLPASQAAPTLTLTHAHALTNTYTHAGSRSLSLALSLSLSLSLVSAGETGVLSYLQFQETCPWSLPGSCTSTALTFS